MKFGMCEIIDLFFWVAAALMGVLAVLCFALAYVYRDSEAAAEYLQVQKSVYEISTRQYQAAGTGDTSGDYQEVTNEKLAGLEQETTPAMGGHNATQETYSGYSMPRQEDGKPTVQEILARKKDNEKNKKDPALEIDAPGAGSFAILMAEHMPEAENPAYAPPPSLRTSYSADSQDNYKSLQETQQARVERLTGLGVVLPLYEWGALAPLTYAISLSDDLQYFTLELCAAYGILEFYELVLALQYRESGYQAHLISSTNDYGISQINQCNHSWLRRELGLTDFLDPAQSILAGIHIFAGYLHEFVGMDEDERVHRALMSYNMGGGGARSAWARGTRSTSGSRRVVSTWETLLATGGV